MNDNTRLREVCFLIGAQDSVLWSDAGDSPVAIADSRARWQAIWQRRERVLEIAHTHPLGGLHFSSEDETTMQALDSALGKRLRYAVVTPDAMLRRDPERDPTDHTLDDEPWWTALIRQASGLSATNHPLTKE